MSSLTPLAISIGDLSGVGFEIALEAHEEVAKLSKPIYCLSEAMAHQAAALLGRALPEGFVTSPIAGEFRITPAQLSAQSGRYSYDSFLHAVDLARSGEVAGVVTLPIHKEAWALAQIPYKGHTDALRDLLDSEAIMMLGCEALYVALFTEHIPLRDVASKITHDALYDFLIRLYRETHEEHIALLGLNPHAGDHGVLGDEERVIESAIQSANEHLGKTIFWGPVVPDVAFTPRFRSHVRLIVAMYHDQGLAPLKALYFDEGINISLGLPIIRTSVDHGTAFDIAYQGRAQTLSYLNAIRAAVDAHERRSR